MERDREHFAKGKRAGALLIWIVTWEALSKAIGNPLLLCGPLQTAQALFVHLTEAEFWLIVLSSIEKIGCGFLSASLLGLTVGAVAAKFEMFRTLLAPLVHAIKSTPVACIIVLLLIWMSSAWIATLVVLLVVFPSFYIAALEAYDARSRSMEEMLHVFQVPFSQRLVCFLWPSALPFIRAAIRTSAGMAWKSGVAAELIGIPSLSIGEQVYLAKLSLSTADLFSWTITVICLGIISEKIVLSLLDGIGSTRVPILRSSSRKHRKALSKQEGEVRFEMRNVSKAYRGNPVLRTFSYVFEQGSRTCVMAPSGTGKTTLLRLLSGLAEPDCGILERPDTVSIVFQETRLFETLSAIENIRVVARSESEVEVGSKLLRNILSEQALYIPVSELSGGMKRKVELCRALAHTSSCLVLDEPFSGLDEDSKRDAVSLIRKHSSGRALVVATHEESDAELLKAEILRLPTMSAEKTTARITPMVESLQI